MGCLSDYLVQDILDYKGNNMGDINLTTADVGQIMNQTVGIVIASYLTNKQKDDLIERLRIIQGLALQTLTK